MKKIYFLTMLSFFTLNLFCQINWVRHPDNPVLEPGDSTQWDKDLIRGCSVIFLNDTYHMWYAKKHIGYATSVDGVNWTKYEGNPVMLAGEEGSWDEGFLWGPEVLFIDNEFHIWYTGHKKDTPTNSNQKIGHATSPDGINWARDTNNPVIDVGPDGSWDDVVVWMGSALYDGSEYHIWYAGWDGTDDNVITGHANSPDGTTWTKDPKNPVLTAGSWDSPRCYPGAMLFDGVQYHCWYNGGESGAHKIGYATSENGSVWEKYDSEVMVGGMAGEWDANSVTARTVMYDSAQGKYKMWYIGGNESGSNMVGYAESELDTTIDLTEYLLSEFIIYPNPVTDILSIETSTPGPNTIELYSLSGQLLFKRQTEGHTFQLDLSPFQKGIYFINVRSRDQIWLEKIIKL